MSDPKKDENRKPRSEKRQEEQERHERDLSPSALSQSSASAVLEWDPSADVGTRFSRRSNQDAESADSSGVLSTLERMAITLTSDFALTKSQGPSARSFRTAGLGLVRSHSEEDTPAVDIESVPKSHRSASMIDLAVAKFVPSKKLPIEKIKVQERKDTDSPTGSSTSSTVKSASRHNKKKSFPVDQTQRLILISTNGSTVSTKRDGNPDTLPSSAPATGGSYNQRLVSSTTDLQGSSNDEENILTDLSEKENRKTTRGDSEASTDWEYGPSRSRSQDKDASNSLPEWQSELTKSEITYQNRRRDDSGSTGSFSIRMHLTDGSDQPNQAGLSHQPRSKVSKQSQKSHDSVEDTSLSDQTSHGGLSHQQRSKVSKQSQKSHDSVEDTSQDQSYKEISQPQLISLVQSSAATKGSSRVESSTQVKTSGSNSSKDQYMKVRRHRSTQVPSSEAIVKANVSADEICSNLSSTCNLLIDMAKHSPGIPDSEILAALRAHRLTHIKRFRRELRRLNELNRILDSASPVNSDPSSSSSSKSDSPLATSSPSSEKVKGPRTSKKSHARTSRAQPQTSTSNKPVGSKRAPVSFFIPFPGCKWEENGIWMNENENENLHQVGSATPLQEVYERVRPQTVSKMQHRENILAQMKQERQKRAEIKREWIRTHPPEEMAGLADVLPPKGERIMTTREMKELTKNKYKKLAEVTDKMLQRARMEEKNTNRLMSQHFAHNLRKKILRGENNIDHCRSIIRGG